MASHLMIRSAGPSSLDGGKAEGDVDPAAGWWVGWLAPWPIWTPEGLQPAEISVRRDAVSVWQPAQAACGSPPRTLAVMNREQWRAWLHDPHRAELVVDDLAWFRRAGVVCVEVLDRDTSREEQLDWRAQRTPPDRATLAVDSVPVWLLRALLEVV